MELEGREERGIPLIAEVLRSFTPVGREGMIINWGKREGKGGRKT